jgi:hypothetical protein
MPCDLRRQKHAAGGELSAWLRGNPNGSLAFQQKKPSALSLQME